VIKRLRSEKVKALSEARLRSTFDAIEDGYWDWDIGTGQIETNDKWFTMLGFNPNEFPATYENFIKLVHPQDINNIIQQIEAAQSDHDRQYNIEYRLRMKSGDYKYIQSRGKFIRIVGDEKPIRMVGTHTDISDRKRFEEDRLLFFDTQRKLLQVTTLEELNDLVGNCLHKLTHDGYISISRIDQQTRTTKVVGFYGLNKTLEEVLKKYHLSTSNLKTRLDEIDPEDLKLWQSSKLVKYEKGIYGILNKKVPKRICQMMEKNLGLREIYFMGCKLNSIDFGGFTLFTKNGLGQNRELIETLINDTAIAIQRILIENESRETQARYQSIYKESPVGIVTVGADLKFISANAEFCRFIGYSENELTNIRFTDITHPENLNRDSENIKKLLADEISVYNTIKKYIRKDGDVVSAKVVVNKICDPQRNLIYFLAMVTDITRELAVEEAIKENQKFLEIVLNTIPNFVFVRDIEGRYQLSNKAFADAMGSTAQEIIGVSDQVLREDANLDNTVRLQDIEILQTSKDWIEPDVELSFPKIGKLPVHFIKRALPVIENKTPAVLGVITDISERKKIEQEIRNREEKYRTLFTTMRQGAFYQDIDKNILEINPAALEIFGLTEEEFNSGLLAEISARMFDENGVKIDISDLPSNTAAKTRKPVVGQTISFINHKTNRETWIVVDAIPQFRDNEQNPYQVFVTLNDITLLKQIEKELRNSELRYRTLIQNSPAGIYQADITGNVIYSNERLCNITGLDFDAITGAGWVNGIHPDDKQNVFHRWQAFVQNGGRWTSEYRQLNQKTGQVSWVYDEAVELLNEEGIRIGFIGSVVELTEQKIAEEKLIKSEAKYRLLTENMKDVIWTLDTQTLQFSYVSPSIESLRGYTTDEVLSGTLSDALTVEGAKLFAGIINQKVEKYNRGELNSSDFFTYEIPQPKKDGSVIWTEIITSLHHNPETGHLDLHGVTRDINDRKGAENSLRKNEEKYRLLAENMKDVIWTLDTETMQITYMSPSIEKLRGYTVEEAMAQGIDDKLLNANPETVRTLMKSQIAEFLKDPNGPEKYYTQEFKQLKKDGSTIWTEIITNYFLNQETGHVELKGVSRDISERKQSELERQSLFEIMQGLSRSKDIDQFLQLIHQVLLKIIDARNISIVFFNKETGLFEEIYCIDEFDKPYPPSKLEKSLTSYVFRTSKSVILGDKAFKQLTKLGEVRLVGSPSAVWMGAPIKDGDDVIGVIAVQNYVDENAYSERDKEFLSSVAAQVAVAIKQKRAEEAIQRSEEKHRLLIENSHDIIYTLNLEGKFTFVSNAWSAFLGYPTSEIIGQSLSRFLNTKSRRTFQEFFDNTIRSGQSQLGVEYQIKHADGSWRWHTTNAVPIKNEDGTCIGIEGTARDVTERKLAEAALHDSEERYRVLVENSPVGIILIQNRKLIYINPSGTNLFGYKSMADMLSLKLLDLLHPESQTAMFKRAFELRKGKENSPMEFKIIKKSGEVCETETISSKVKIFGEDATLIFIQDISERKKAEEKIRKNTEDLTLLQKLNDLVNQGGSLQKCMELINEETRKHLSGNGASVYLLDSEKEYLELQSYQLPNETIKGIEQIIGFKIPKVKIKLNPNSKYQQILSGKKLQYFEGEDQVMGLMLEFTTNPILKKLIPAIYKQLGIFSVISIPLMVQNESVGLLEFSSKTSYKKEDLNRFEFLALELASVIRRKQAEEALKDSEAKFRQIVEKSNDIFLIENFNTLGFEYISPKIYDLLGYPQSEFMHATKDQIIAVIHPDDVHIFDDLRQQLIQSWQSGGKNLLYEFRVKNKAGEYKWFTANYSLVVDDNLEPKFIMSTMSDITERKLNELSLRFRVKIMQLAPKLSMNELLAAVLDEVEEITDSRFGFYHFVDQDESSMSLMAWSTNTMSKAGGVLSEENAHAIEQKGVWLECLKQRRPVIHNEPESITPYDINIEKHLHIFRELAIPVMRKDKIVSVLGLGNKSSNYTLGDLELVSKLADMVWDVIENKKIESELRESKAIFSAFMENSPIFVFFKDKEGRSIQLSRNYETVLGKPVDKLLHKRMDEIFPPRIAHKMIEDDLQVIKDGKASVIDEELGGRTYSTIRFPVVKEGLPEFLAGFSIDITDRVLSQKKLAESEEMYRLISSVVSDYLFSTRVTDDGTLDLNWVAGAFEKITGYTMAEYKQMGGWKAALYPGDFETDNHDMQMLSLNQKVITEVRTIRKNGEVVWVRVYSQPIWDEEQNCLVGINGAVQDITDRKKVEEEINKSVEEFKALYDTAMDFSLHRDPYVILKTISDRACSLFAASNAFVYLFDPNQNDLELKFTRNPYQPLGMRVKIGEGISGLVAEKLSPLVVIDYSTWKGRHSEPSFDNVAAVMCVPMLYGGQLIGVLGVHENHPSELVFSEDDAHFLTLFASQAAGALYSADLFEKIRQNANELEKKVDERTKELKLKNKELETFTYTVSHDLKAPLRGISGYATLLKEDYSNQLDSEARRYLENLVNSTERMSQLIEDLLAYSRVERREIKKTNINLDMLVEKITEEYKHGVVTGKLNFKKEIEYGTVFTDEEALNQALRNLIDNAVKFTREQSDPEIWIRSTKLEDHCLISIEDNGIGFDMKYYDKIFEIFQRLHLSEDYPGTGIGLAVVRKAVERLGGKIWAVSQPGEGSTFFMELPL
jgi:PAS domain S-box-containing protein